MARKSKKSKGIIIALFIILLVACGCSGIYYIKVFKPAKDKYNKASANKPVNEKITEIDKQIEEVNKEIENLNKINIEDAKKELFAEAKKLEDKIIAGESSAKIAYLTFDDGPYYKTYDFLDVLDKYNIKATFFTTNINGENCYDNKKYNCHLLYPEYLKRGHTIANHTFTHGWNKGLYYSVNNFITALKDQENMISELTGGYKTNIVRFPGGSNTAGGLKQPIIAKLKEIGYGWVDWSALDGDGGDLSSTTEAWSKFKGSINQDIEVVLMHDYNRYTLAILPEAIEYLQEKGYILLPLFYESNMINK